MRIRLWVVTTIAASMILMGCGGPKHFEDEHAKYDPTMSKAMNIALLTGLTHAERGPLKDSVLTSSDKESGMSDAAMANLAAGSFDLLSGGIGLGVVTSFMFKTFQPEWKNHVFAWMPKSLAKNEADAAMVMCKTLLKAVKQVSFENDPVESIEECNVYRAWHDATRFTIHFKSGLIAGAQIASPVPLSTPSYMAKSESYYWSYLKTNSDTSPIIDIFYGIPRGAGRPAPLYKTKQLLIELSQYLPNWTEIYIAPDTKSNEPAYFLESGTKLFFIKPS